MTEAEWLACGDTEEMLAAVRPWSSERKSRLFACACCRRVWHQLGETQRSVVVVAERYADGGAARDERRSAAKREHDPGVPYSRGRQAGTRAVTFAIGVSMKAAGPERGESTRASASCRYAVRAAAYAAVPTAESVDFRWDAPGADWALACTTERQAQCVLLRDLFSTPCVPAPSAEVPLTAFRLAQAAYDERILPAGHLDPARLGVLSDALEEAGCTDADLLSHLRSAGPHVRGCWALDLVLGKG